MTDLNERAVVGHNRPPLDIQIAEAYSPERLAEDHAELAMDCQTVMAQADKITTVTDEASNEAAAKAVLELRRVIGLVDGAKEPTKRPILNAARVIDAFFNGLNSTDAKKPGPLSQRKTRIEREIGAHAFRVAEANRIAAEAAAKRERDRAQAEADAAAKLEQSGQTAVADVVMGQAVKSEAFAERFERTAAGPVTDLARQHTSVGTVGLRGTAAFEITDREALRATLGPLGNHFTQDAVEAAIRKLQASAKTMGVEPALAGVRFYVAHTGSVRG